MVLKMPFKVNTFISLFQTFSNNRKTKYVPHLLTTNSITHTKNNLKLFEPTDRISYHNTAVTEVSHHLQFITMSEISVTYAETHTTVLWLTPRQMLPHVGGGGVIKSCKMSTSPLWIVICASC